MSKFDYMPFLDGSLTYIAFNARRYTEQDAVVIASSELDMKPEDVKIAKGYVRFGFGVDDDGCMRNGWWLERTASGKSHEAIVCGGEYAMNYY